jgi:hypothetical protein
MQIADVQLFGAIPEPASLGLLSFGAVGILMHRRRA